MTTTLPTNQKLPKIKRVKGNREPIGATLRDINGAAKNLTSKTIKFRMVNTSDNSVKVNNADAALDDAASGQVSYTPGSADVDTAGEYACYFLDTTTEPNKRYPYDGAQFVLVILEEGAEC